MITTAIGKATAPHRRPALAWGLAGIALTGGVLQVASCKEPANGAATLDGSASAAVSAAPPASAGALPENRDDPGSDAIQPVYPVDHLPPLPLAETYCNGVRELPQKRRDACCPRFSSYAPTGECTRTLSSALRSGAVTLDPAQLDACVAAMTKETEGCDWVTSTGTPTATACLGILKGTLKVGAVCRSNLECEEGMRCRNLGATRPGRCGPPLAELGPCNLAIDSLASFSGQNDMERHHPECAGYCGRRQCHDAIAAGAACTASFECGPKGHCAGGKCATGPLPAPGQACTDLCASGARCSKGKCLAAKAGGESCEEDAECRGRCAREDGGKAGKCAADCPSFLLPEPKKR